MTKHLDIKVYAALLVLALLLTAVTVSAQDDPNAEPTDEAAAICPFGFVRGSGMGPGQPNANANPMGNRGQGGNQPNANANANANPMGNRGQGGPNQPNAMGNGPAWGQRQGPGGRLLPGGPNGEQPCLSVPADVELTDDVIAILYDAWAEEQLAYASYNAIIEQFGEQRPFTNIARAEAQHISSIEFLFNLYGVPLPEPYEFEPVAFASLDDAYAAASAIEAEDIALYDAILVAVADYPPIVRVFTNLQNASYNHQMALSR